MAIMGFVAVAGTAGYASSGPMLPSCPLYEESGDILVCEVAELGAATLDAAGQTNTTASIALPLPRLGKVDVLLQPVSLFTEDALVVELINGVSVVTKPEPKTFVGWIRGDVESEVRLTLVGSAVKGIARIGDQKFFVEPAAEHGFADSSELVLVYSQADLRIRQPPSQGNDVVEAPAATGPPAIDQKAAEDPNATKDTAASTPAALTTTTPVSPTHSTIPAKYFARVFLASDDEFRSRYSDWKGEQQAWFNIVDSTFSSQLDVRLRISGQFALSTSNMPGPRFCYDATDAVLRQFRDHVEGSPTYGPSVIPRDISVLNSGRDFWEGLTQYLGCSYQTQLQSSWAYSVVAIHDLFITSNAQVLAHEMGHVFGGYHQDNPNRPPNTGAHSFGSPYFCLATFDYALHSLMWSPAPLGCTDWTFSDGSVDPTRNNKAYMLSHEITPKLRKVGYNLIAGISPTSFSSSGDLWGHYPWLAGDGYLDTYWWADREVSWWQVLLPGLRYLQRAQIHGWVGYYLASFALKLSPDGSSWTTVFSGGSTSTVDFNMRFPAMWARYVRLEAYDIYRTGGALNEYAVIREVEAFETVNVASWRPGSSSGNLWGHQPYMAADDNLGTYWWGTSSSGSWIRYDFPATCAAYFRLRMYPTLGVRSLEVRVVASGTEYATGYGWSSYQEEVFLPTPSSGCSFTAIKLTFWETAQGAYNNYPVVREVELYYGE